MEESHKQPQSTFINSLIHSLPQNPTSYDAYPQTNKQEWSYKSSPLPLKFSPSKREIPHNCVPDGHSPPPPFFFSTVFLFSRCLLLENEGEFPSSNTQIWGVFFYFFFSLWIFIAAAWFLLSFSS